LLAGDIPVGDNANEHLLRKYLKHCARNLSSVNRMNGVYRIKVDDMKLNDFFVARQQFCRSRHKKYCHCQKLIMVAADILQNGFLPLKDLFCKHFGCIASKFKTDKAVSRMMQLPVAVVPLNINGGKKIVCL